MTSFLRLILVFVISTPHFLHLAFALPSDEVYAVISSAQFGQYHLWMSTVYPSCFLDSCMPIAISAILSDAPCCHTVSSQLLPPFLCEASDNPFFVHSIFHRNLFIYCPINENHFGHFKAQMRTYVLPLTSIITPIDLNVNRGFACCRRIPTANDIFLKFCRIAQK